MKKYTGVYFPKNEWAVVPTKWICDLGQKTFCYWPDSGSVEGLARSNADVQSSWTLYNVVREAEKSDNFDKAIRKMMEGDASESEAKLDSTFETPINEAKQSKFTKLTQPQRKNDALNYDIEPGTTILSKRSLFNSTPLDVSSSEESECTLERSKKLPHRIINEEYIPCEKRNDVEINSLFESVKNEMKEIKEEIKQLKSTIVNNSMLIEDLVSSNFTKPVNYEVPSPASTVEELQEISSLPYISEILISCEEPTLNRTVTAMLKVLMKRELAMNYSVSGRDKARQETKLKFHGTTAYRAIHGTLLKIPKFTQSTGIDIKKSLIEEQQRLGRAS